MISNPLGRLFSRSPLSALQRHMEKAQECASELLPLFDATLAGDWERAQAVFRGFPLTVKLFLLGLHKVLEKHHLFFRRALLAAQQ